MKYNTAASLSTVHGVHYMITLPHGNAALIGTGEVAFWAAAVFSLLVREVTAVVPPVAESAVRDTAVVARTAPIAGRTRVAVTIFPCIVDAILRVNTDANLHSATISLSSLLYYSINQSINQSLCSLDEDGRLNRQQWHTAGQTALRKLALTAAQMLCVCVYKRLELTTSNC